MKIDTMEEHSMLIFSTRYAMGRMSMAPSIMSDIIKSNLGVINTNTLSVISRDIGEADEDNMLGMKDIDVPLWGKLKKVIDEELLRRA